MGKDKFKDRYVLGEGYPWALGTNPYYEINLQPRPYLGGERIPLDWPEEFGSNLLPKYRLILERVTTSVVASDSPENDHLRK